MAIKRTIDTRLWYDPLISDKFTKDDKLFWLYCLSNPHNNLCGVAIISPKLMALETGIEPSEINLLIEKFSTDYKRILYSYENSELIILNWYKYNWSTSLNVKQSLEKQIEDIKTDKFKSIIIEIMKDIKWSDKSNGKTTGC